MNPTARWLLVLPVALAATAVSWILLTLAWNITSTVNIVPQLDTISVGLANFGINAISAGLGVLAGTRMAPHHWSRTSIVLGAVYLKIAFVAIAYGVSARERISMSLGWHIWSTIAWVIGTIGGVLKAQNVPSPK